MHSGKRKLQIQHRTSHTYVHARSTQEIAASGYIVELSNRSREPCVSLHIQDRDLLQLGGTRSLRKALPARSPAFESVGGSVIARLSRRLCSSTVMGTIVPASSPLLMAAPLSDAQLACGTKFRRRRHTRKSGSNGCGSRTRHPRRIVKVHHVHNVTVAFASRSQRAAHNTVRTVRRVTRALCTCGSCGTSSASEGASMPLQSAAFSGSAVGCEARRLLEAVPPHLRHTSGTFDLHLEAHVQILIAAHDERLIAGHSIAGALRVKWRRVCGKWRRAASSKCRPTSCSGRTAARAAMVKPQYRYGQAHGRVARDWRAQAGW